MISYRRGAGKCRVWFVWSLAQQVEKGEKRCISQRSKILPWWFVLVAWCWTKAKESLWAKTGRRKKARAGAQERVTRSPTDRFAPSCAPSPPPPPPPAPLPNQRNKKKRCVIDTIDKKEETSQQRATARSGKEEEEGAPSLPPSRQQQRPQRLCVHVSVACVFVQHHFPLPFLLPSTRPHACAIAAIGGGAQHASPWSTAWSARQPGEQ